MKRFYAITALALLIIAVRIFYVPLPAPEVDMHTRGPVFHNLEFEAAMMRLQEEDRMPVLDFAAVLLDTPIHINGEIPLWGVIGMVVAAGIVVIKAALNMRDAMTSLKQRQDSHEAEDTKRFSGIAELIATNHTQLREDIRNIGVSRGRAH